MISLAGENVGGIENLYYKLAYRHQDVGDADSGDDDETGYVASLGHVFAITDRVAIDALVEYVDIENFDGDTDDNQYFTTSVISTLDDHWNITVAYTERDIDSAGGDSDDELLQNSGGYDFGQGTTVQFGWRGSEEGGADTDIVGGLVRHTFDF